MIEKNVFSQRLVVKVHGHFSDLDLIVSLQVFELLSVFFC